MGTAFHHSLIIIHPPLGWVVVQMVPRECATLEEEKNNVLLRQRMREQGEVEQIDTFMSRRLSYSLGMQLTLPTPTRITPNTLMSRIE